MNLLSSTFSKLFLHMCIRIYFLFVHACINVYFNRCLCSMYNVCMYIHCGIFVFTNTNSDTNINFAN